MTPQEARIISDFLLPQIEQEVQTTTKVLAAVPEDKKDYTPESKCDTKCMTAGELVRHIAGTDLWFLDGIINGEFAQEPPVSGGPIADIAANYQHRAGELLAKLKQLPAEHLAKDVQFFMWNLPNATYLQFMQKHSVHHRGQLSAYLRPMGAKVPSIYGGSADEPFTAAAGEGN
jgi:uncharacterized damage-inducible protein DinB